MLRRRDVTDSHDTEIKRLRAALLRYAELVPGYAWVGRDALAGTPAPELPADCEATEHGLRTRDFEYSLGKDGQFVHIYALPSLFRCGMHRVEVLRALLREPAPAPARDEIAPTRPHHLRWSGVEWVDDRCGCRYHPDDNNGSHGGAPHVHRCDQHPDVDRFRFAIELINRRWHEISTVLHGQDVDGRTMVRATLRDVIDWLREGERIERRDEQLVAAQILDQSEEEEIKP